MLQIRKCRINENTDLSDARLDLCFSCHHLMEIWNRVQRLFLHISRWQYCTSTVFDKLRRSRVLGRTGCIKDLLEVKSNMR